MTKHLSLIILSLCVIGLTNCSPKGFESASSTASKAANGNAGLGADPTTPDNTQIPTADPLAAVDLKLRVDSNNVLTSSFNQALTFDLDKTRGEFIVMIPFPSGVFFSPSGSFNQYPDITYSPIIDAEGRMKFAVRIPIKYIIKGASFLPPASLPNGDPLPAMPQGYGELPSLGLTFPAQNNTQVTIYIGVNAIGLYVSLPPKAALPMGFTLPIKNSDKTKTYGYLSYVPPKGTYAPGLFVSTIIPASVSRILEDYFHL